MRQRSLYETVLDAAGQRQLPPPLPPRASASVVPWRRRREEIEVYWVRRSAAVPFMPGWHAFPGGGVARSDAAVAVSGCPSGLLDGGRASFLPESLDPSGEGFAADDVPGLVAGALRELFEEVGLLLGAPAVDASRLTDAQRRLLAKEAPFANLLAELGVRLDAARLTFAGRWLTPPFAELRFDNRFFLLEWPEGEIQQPHVIPGELSEGEWIAARQAFDRWRRDDVLTAPPIQHLLRVLAEDGPERGLGRLQVPAEADLGPLRRIEFRHGVILFPLATPTLPPATHTNCYLLGTGETVLVDPGSPFEPELDALEAALSDRRLDRRLTAIWLTHHHPDHVGGVERLRHSLGVPVLAHVATAERLACRGIAVDATLDDDQRLVLPGDPDFAIRVLHTPGHARGHLSFHVETTGATLCGDLLSAVSTIVVDPPEGDMGAYLASLERLSELAPRTLFPAHGPPLLDGSAFIGRLLRHRRDREARILSAWQSGLQTPAEILPVAYQGDRLAAAVLPLAERQIVAHLDHLRRRGSIP